MNSWIERVKKELIPQLWNVDEVIISHQITEKNIQPELENLWKNVKYIYMYEKWLSKNRNNALKYATADICHICDDDLDYRDWFEKIILAEYEKNEADIITFQALTPSWNKHFQVSQWKHTRLSILRIWSWWITFRRESLVKNNRIFDENFWLWARYPVWEENIFLADAIKLWCTLRHSDQAIVIHPEESSGINYRDELIIARIKVWKRLFWFFWWVFAVFYFTIFHFKFYKNQYSIWGFFCLSCKSLVYE